VSGVATTQLEQDTFNNVLGLITKEIYLINIIFDKGSGS
jgi:hypothetical protein